MAEIEITIPSYTQVEFDLADVLDSLTVDVDGEELANAFAYMSNNERDNFLNSIAHVIDDGEVRTLFSGLDDHEKESFLDSIQESERVRQAKRDEKALEEAKAEAIASIALKDVTHTAIGKLIENKHCARAAIREAVELLVQNDKTRLIIHDCLLKANTKEEK